MNGPDLVAALRKRSVDPPAILTTGRTSPGLRMSAEAAGLPIVEKPLLGNGLLEPSTGL